MVKQGYREDSQEDFGNIPGGEILDMNNSLAGVIQMRILLCLLLVVIADRSLGQDSRLLTRGSADQFGAAIDAQNSWRDAKKITLLATVPDLPLPEQGESMDLSALKQGQIGKLSYWNFKVTDVVDEKNSILTLGSQHRIWLEGYSTAGLVNDQSVRIIDYVEVSGTKSYETVLGAKSTVWVVKLLPADLEFRDWKAKNGKVVNGKFVEYKNSKVWIEQRDGKQISFPLSALTDADKDFAQERIKEKRGKKSPSPK